MKLMTEEALNTLHLAREEERSETNVSRQRAELVAAVMQTMQRICKIGSITIEKMVIFEYYGRSVVFSQ